ncbi:hypothetical protein, partial [Ensifer aridi]|uniref:hypothetical protein n=1 Tax=Ensifer aridi TaxID=1708715 RepID=UPI001FCD353A
LVIRNAASGGRYAAMSFWQSSINFCILIRREVPAPCGAALRRNESGQCLEFLTFETANKGMDKAGVAFLLLICILVALVLSILKFVPENRVPPDVPEVIPQTRPR